MAQETSIVRRGIYNVEHFSGAQVSIHIGDVWVDEVTTLNYGYTQNRRPIYGYASQLYDGLSKGQILIQGTFTINFKEAGYLWLILNRYQGKLRGADDQMKRGTPFSNSGSASKNTIERFVNNEVGSFERNRLLQNLVMQGTAETAESLGQLQEELVSGRLAVQADLGGYASSTRAVASKFNPNKRKVGKAEGLYEEFEDAVWGKPDTERFLEGRRPDEDALNPFDMYISFGDFAGDNSANHTIEKLETVTILGKSKRIQIDGLPIQEQYTFIARNLI
jgi:hypothetical protein